MEEPDGSHSPVVAIVVAVFVIDVGASIVTVQVPGCL